MQSSSEGGSKKLAVSHACSQNHPTFKRRLQLINDLKKMVSS